MQLGLFDLLVHLSHSGGVAFGCGGGAKARVHLGVLIGFAGDGDLQGLGRGHAGLRVQQVQVPKGVHHFLVGGVLKGARRFLVTSGAGQFGEVAVLDVCHRFAGKGGLQVGHGLDVGAGCGHRGLLLIALINRKMRNHRINQLIEPIDNR